MPRLAGLKIAVTKAEGMATFYKRVFGAVLREREVGGFALFVGEFAGVHLQLCPAEIAGIEATQNRHQLTIAVDDVSASIALAREHGDEALGESAIRDPDGNSIELIQST